MNAIIQADASLNVSNLHDNGHSSDQAPPAALAENLTMGCPRKWCGRNAAPVSTLSEQFSEASMNIGQPDRHAHKLSLPLLASGERSGLYAFSRMRPVRHRSTRGVLPRASARVRRALLLPEEFHQLLSCYHTPRIQRLNDG